MIATSPVLGVGLGQFRDRYLAFKLPDSSEEIADPHNLLLDVWANGGLIALAGLIGLLGVIWYRVWRMSLGDSQRPRSTTAEPLRRWNFAGVAAFALTILAQWWGTGVWDETCDRLAVFAVVWLVFSAIVQRRLPPEASEQGWIGWLAALTLAVHLLGAGGIAMPAVTQLWFVLIAWGLSTETEASSSRAAAWPLAYAAICLAGCFGCFWSGVWPVWQARFWDGVPMNSGRPRPPNSPPSCRRSPPPKTAFPTRS